MNNKAECENCEKRLYKGDDEQYCMAARMREIYLTKYQKRPKWCPIESRKRRLEWEKRKEEKANEDKG